MQVILEGKIRTPVVTRDPSFYLKGYQASIKKGTIRRHHYSKINATMAMYPYSLICYEGILEVKFTCNSKAQAEEKLDELIAIDQIGGLQAEGMGQIEWLGGYLDGSQDKQLSRTHRKLKIRKGLPHDLPVRVQELVRYGILHDFFHNDRHKSKIYVEPPLKDANFIELLKDHHKNEKQSIIVETFQKYDRIASSITRKHRSPRSNRYNWKATKKVNFEDLATQLAEVSDNVWKLYECIYQNKQLAVLNEAFEFGHTSLRMHLLLIANLIVFDHLKDNLVLK